MNTSIVFYGTSWCPDSRRCRTLLDSRKIAYNYRDIEQDAEACAIVEQMNQGMRSVPTIVFPDGTHLVEPATSQLAEKLTSLGLA